MVQKGRPLVALFVLMKEETSRYNLKFMFLRSRMRPGDGSIDNDFLSQLLASGSSDDSKPASQGSGDGTPPQHEELAGHSAITSAQLEIEIIELFNQHSAALGRYAGSMTRDSTVAQDAIQEAFLRYFKTRTSGRSVENPRAWLFHVLRNYVLNCIRKCSFLQPVELEAASNMTDVKQDVEAAYELSQAFRHAISSLSPRERECVQLRIEGFGYDEIAQILGIRSSTVSATLTRSLSKIRKTGILMRRK
jgi:RNA polymerase sigma-70 factor, ECF subfamily